eukprot:SAG31_NODE_6743_length_1903_cov_1.521064_1_plen_142_part_00
MSRFWIPGQRTAQDASKIGRAEWQRCCLLIGELAALDAVPVTSRDLFVSGELYRKGEMNFFRPFVENPKGAFPQMMAKTASEWGREDAIMVAACMSRFVPSCCVGLTEILRQAKHEVTKLPKMSQNVSKCLKMSQNVPKCP